MKKEFYVLILLFLLTLTSCGKPTGGGLPDNLGGGGTGSQTEESTLSITDAPAHEVESKNTPVINFDNAINIDLSELDTEHLEIKESGTYNLSGEFTGNITVDGNADKIIIILNNVSITLPSTSTSSVFTFKKHSGTRILHILEGTTNNLIDHELNDDTGDGAIIQAKKSSLIINGKGTLNINGIGTETTGIKVKNQLEIYDTALYINVTDNGIKAGDLLSIKNAYINITCGNDGIKTDVEAETEDEGNELVKDIYSGYLYIYNTFIKIISKDDGISANSYLKINNSIDFTIDIITNNGPTYPINELNSDNANGKAIRVSGISLVTETDEIELLSQYKDNYLLIILGGKYFINSNDDAVTSKGNLIINNGEFEISTGDDAIHAEYLTKIFNGNIQIKECYEGIEGASVEIYGGIINLISVDDGINAANSDLTNWSYNIYIGNGTITINSEGDGIDSNGTVEITGGTIKIFGPTRNDNAALDADKGILMNGGILFAFGPSGMIETPGSNSKQNVIVYNLSSKVSANSTFNIYGSETDMNYSITVSKTFQSVIISAPEITTGLTFTLSCNNEKKEVTINNIITTIGQTFGGPGGGRPNRPW